MSRIHPIQYFLYFLLLFSIQLVGQISIEQRYSIRHYTPEDGLFHSAIADIEGDENGFLWVATTFGIYRFDGRDFKFFTHEESNKNSLSNDLVYCLLNHDDKMWIGTQFGLCYYDNDKNQFTSIEQLKENRIVDLDNDIYGNIYASLSDNGIAIITPDSTKGSGFSVTINTFFTKLKLRPKRLRISNNGTLWVGTIEGYLYYGKTDKDSKNIIFKELVVPIKLEDIRVINSNSDKELFIGTRNGLYKLNIHSKEIEIIKPFKKKKFSVFDIKWKNNNLWIATAEGLYIYNDNLTDFIKYQHNETDPKSLSINNVTSIFFDSFNQIWLGTGKHLNLLYNNPAIHTIQTNSNTSNSLTSNIIYSIFKDADDLWIGTSEGGLNLHRNKQFYSFSHKTHNLSSGPIFNILKNNNTIWVGTANGLSLFESQNDPQSIKFKNIYHNPEDENSISTNSIRQIYKDTSNTIWITTYDGGLNRFTGNLEKGQISFQSYKHDTNKKNSLLSNVVYCIIQLKNDDYWLGTNKGLQILSFKEKDFNTPVFKSLITKNKTHLEKVVVPDIFEDNKGNVWIGTTKGLWYYDSVTNQLNRYTKKNGIPDETVYGILQDSNNDIWISTNKGISCFDIENKTFTNYTQEDGLASTEHNLYAKFFDSSGMLYFGGKSGISYFKPEELSKLDKESKLYIDNIQVTNQSTQQLEYIQYLSNNTLKIKSKQFPFYVNFSEINLSYFKNSTFAYRLKPDHINWNYIQDKKQIQFLNLSSGNYTLEIQGVTRGKVWENTDPIKLPIEIIPLWWKSKWTYLIYSLLFLSLVYAFYQFSLRRKLEHQENIRLLELDELKTKLFNNITHELRTPLTVIMGMTESIVDGMNAEHLKKFKTKFDILSKNNKKLLFLINQMLDLSKVESGNMHLSLVQDDIIPYIKVNLDSFHSLANNKKIDLIYYDEITSLTMDFDPEKITIVISNLISNAIKFTDENGKIILHVNKIIRNNISYLLLKIKDDGIGISAEDQKHIFDRFYQADTHILTDGTGIGLSLTNEVVELMNGCISVDSELHKGTEFIVEIPITNKADILSVTPKPKTSNIKADVPSSSYEELSYKDGLPLILIVEDNKDVAHFIASCLDKDYNIIFAKDGQEGIETTFERIPDIVITDLMMPNVNGLELTKALKEDVRSSHIPIIILTARSLEEDRFKGLKYGADAYLTKPFNKKELLIRVEQLILLRKKLQVIYASYLSDNSLSKKTNDREAAFLKKIITIIEKDISNSQLNAHSIAANIAMSESQLYRKLKAISGKSTAVFIRSIRLIEAKRLLETTDLNISEIAYECGFNEPSWFSKVFKEEYSVSPSTFRK